jgi:hypothetical protein
VLHPAVVAEQIVAQKDQAIPQEGFTPCQPAAGKIPSEEARRTWLVDEGSPVAFDTANARLVGLNIQLVYDLEASVAELLQPVEFMHKALPGHLFAFYRYISGTPIEGTQGVEAQ